MILRTYFPAGPPEETINLVEELLIKNKVNPVINTDIVNLLKTCLRQNYFQFNNTFYNSKEGLIMGSPLSPLLAEIFMNAIELKIHKHSNNINYIYWYRYVDDIITCYTGTERQLNKSLEFLNSLHPNITFTMEVESNSAINFLDLTISRKANKHEFSIFHKPSHTDITIHNTSFHPQQHKLAAFHSMVHRLLHIPLSDENFNTEVNYIKQVAVNNGYSSTIIDDLLKKKTQKKTLSLVFPETRNKQNKFKSLTFSGKPSIKLKKYLNKKQLTVAFKSKYTIGKFLKNSKPRQNKDSKSGVYQLNCGSCSKTYIGQTGRSFETRILEHKRSFINSKIDSNYATHLIEENHSFNGNYKILHTENKGHKLNYLECLEINKLKNSGNLLNDQLDLNHSPLLNIFI